jgi:hypothetical protein
LEDKFIARAILKQIVADATYTRIRPHFYGKEVYKLLLLYKLLLVLLLLLLLLFNKIFSFIHLTQLIVREDFIESCRRESFITLIIIIIIIIIIIVIIIIIAVVVSAAVAV